MKFWTVTTLTCLLLGYETLNLAKAADPKPLSIAFSAELRSMDPSIDNNSFSISTQSTVMETLARTKPDLSVVPLLAESWTSVSPTTWRIKLRSGVKFSNGEPMNADAVVFSLKVYKETRGMSRGYFDFIDKAVAVDETTVDIITRDPTSILPASLAYFYVFPPAHYAKAGVDGFGKNPIGTGPWKLKQWTPGVGLDLDLNADYWGSRPKIGPIQVRWAADASTRVAMLLNDEIQFANDIPPSMLDRVKNSGTTSLLPIKTMRKVFLMMDVTSGITADVRVRQGLNYALDIDSIIKNLFQGHAYGRDKGLILEGLEGYQGDAVKAFTYDPQKAKALFAEAGYPNGFSIDLSHPIGRLPLDKEAAAAIAGQLDKVGVKVTLKGAEPGAFAARVLSATRVPGMVYFNCSPLFVTAVYCSLLNLTPGGIQGYGATEKTGDAIKRIIAELDPTKRVSLIREFEDHVSNELVPVVWLWRQEAIYGLNSKLSFTPQPDEKVYFSDMSWR